MTNLEPDRKKELAFVRKARKLQVIKEAKGRWIHLDARTQIWIEAGENEAEKIKQYKDKLNKWRNRNKN